MDMRTYLVFMNNFFSLQQGNRTVTYLYTSLWAVMDELEIHQLIVPHV